MNRTFLCDNQVPTAHIQLLVEIALETKQLPPRHGNLFFKRKVVKGEKMDSFKELVGLHHKEKTSASLELQDFVFLFLQEWADLF